MRNLKKVLSLALAMVMLLGMMVVGAGATSFTDDADITHQEAVTVVSGMEILTGVGDNTFNPKGTLSRAEAAVVIAKLDLGAAFGNLATTNASTFKDVGAGYGWAKPYIDYCAARGLIAGDGNGYFMPADKVTGVQFALMVARVLGYEDANESVSGPNWEVNAAALARKAGLTIDVELGSNAIPRDDMAQVAFNALTADMVEYKQSAITIGDITIPAGKASPRGNNQANDYRGNTNGDTTLQLCEEKFPKLALKTDDDDGFKRPASTWTYGADTITTVTHDATYTLNDGFKGGKLYSTIGKVAATKYTMTVYVDGVEDHTLAGITKSGNDTDFGGAGNGSVTEVFVDSDNEQITVCTINTYLVRATSNYNTTKEELSVAPLSTGLTLSSSKISNDDVAVSEFKTDDLILVTGTFGTNGKLTVKTAELAEVVENVKVSAYTASKTVTAGGNKYEYSFKTATGFGEGASIANGYTLQSTNYNMFLDKAGYVIAVDKYSSEVTLDDIVFVKEAAKSGFNWLAKVVFMDGTEKTVTVAGTMAPNGSEFKSVDGWQADGTHSTLVTTDGKMGDKQFFEFSEKSNGEYNLKAISSSRQGTQTASGSGSGTKDIVGGDVHPIRSLTTKSATNDTIFIADGTVYTGVKNSPSVVESAVYYLLDSATGNNYLLAAYTEGKGTTTIDVSEYVYVWHDNGTGKDDDGNTYYTYTAAKDGEKDTEFKAATNGKGDGLFMIETYENGYPVLGNALAADKSGVLDFVSDADVSDFTFNGGVVSDGTNGYIMADDAKVYVVDVADKTVDVIDASSISASTLEAGTYDVCAIHTSTSDSKIAVLWLIKTTAGRTISGGTGAEIETALANGPVTVTGPITTKVTVDSGESLTLGTGATATNGIELDGGSVVVDGATSIPTITGKGSVEVKSNVDNATMTKAGVTALGATVSEPTDYKTQEIKLTAPGVKFTGNGTFGTFNSSVQSAIDKATGSTSASLFYIKLPSGANNKYIKGERLVNGTWETLAKGTTWDGSAQFTDLEFVLLLGDTVDAVRFTCGDATGPATNLVTYTFTIER